MDWATHVPLALLRTSVNTFLCLADSVMGASHSGGPAAHYRADGGAKW